MQQTSLTAYFNEVKPTLNAKQQLVFDALEEIYPATNKQLAKHLGWEINSVTPRILELRVKRKVIEAYRDLDNGRKAIFWKPRIVERGEQSEY